jgi:hypothetical protein
LDENILRMMLAGGGPPKRRPIEVKVERALLELGRLQILVPAALVSGPDLADEVLAECERVCIGAAARFHEVRVSLAADPVLAMTPAVFKPGEDE